MGLALSRSTVQSSQTLSNLCRKRSARFIDSSDVVGLLNVAGSVSLPSALNCTEKCFQKSVGPDRFAVQQDREGAAEGLWVSRGGAIGVGKAGGRWRERHRTGAGKGGAGGKFVTKR